MSMKNVWLRQSVHGWVLFLGINSVYDDYKQQKRKKGLTYSSASVGLLLAMTLWYLNTLSKPLDWESCEHA